MELFAACFLVSFYLIWYQRESSFVLWLRPSQLRSYWSNEEIPTMGGISLFISLSFVFALLFGDLPPALWASIPLAVSGTFVGRHIYSHWISFFAQVLAIAIWFYLVPLQDLFLLQLGIGPWESFFLASSLLIFSLNSFEKIFAVADGWGSVLIIISLFFVFQLQGALHNPNLLLGLAGVTLAVFYWSFRPAKIILGPSGAHLIIFLLVTELFTWSPPHFGLHQIFVPLFLLALIFTEGLLSVIHFFRKNLQGPNLYQLFLQAGFSPISSWVLLAVLVISFSLTALLIEQKTNFYEAFSLVGFIAPVIIYLVYLLVKNKRERGRFLELKLKQYLVKSLNPANSIEASNEDQFIVYSFTSVTSELMSIDEKQLELWLKYIVDFIFESHSISSKFFMTAEGDLLVLDKNISNAKEFLAFHEKFQKVLGRGAEQHEFWPLLLLKLLPVFEVQRLPKNVEISIQEIESKKVA